MSYDYSKLLGKIVEKFGKRSAFAKALNVSEHTLSMKLNSKISFKQEEIINACRLLGIDFEEIPAYFFVLKVQSA